MCNPYINGICVECGRPATRLIAWTGERKEGPYSMCDMDAHHSVKNRGATDIGPYEKDKPDGQ